MTHYEPEELPDRDPTPPSDGPRCIKDEGPCDCHDCQEAAWDRLQEVQAESPSEWNQAYKGPIDKREMRRRE